VNKQTSGKKKEGEPAEFHQRRVETSGTNSLDRAAIQESEHGDGYSKNQIYNLEAQAQPPDVTDEGSLLNILVPSHEENTSIAKLVRRIPPESCGICQL
jgi:hypothetical protein